MNQKQQNPQTQQTPKIIKMQNQKIMKMILDTLPRNIPAALDMAPGVLRWEMSRAQQPDALSRIEKAFRENSLVEKFELKQGQVSNTLLFIEVAYVPCVPCVPCVPLSG